MIARKHFPGSGSVRDFSLGRVTGARRYTLEITRITRRLNHFPATPRECLNVSPASCPLIIVSLPEVVIALPIPSYIRFVFRIAYRQKALVITRYTAVILFSHARYKFPFPLNICREVCKRSVRFI